MSFTTEIKRELVRTSPDSREGCLALLQAAIMTCGERTEEGFSFVSENESVAAYLLGIAEKCSCPMLLTAAVRDRRHGRDKLTFAAAGEEARRRAEEIFSQDFSEEETALSFLKGAFLGGGSCILPRGENKTGYHLEFVFPSLSDAALLEEVFHRLLLLCGMVERADKYVIYCKSREGIGDLLSMLGAERSLKLLERTAAERDERNNRNRLENCTAGNVDRSLTASAQQIRTLASLSEGELMALPEPLKETAKARIDNPTFTYTELAAHLGITKSCLQRRLKKLMSLGETP